MYVTEAAQGVVCDKVRQLRGLGCRTWVYLDIWVLVSEGPRHAWVLFSFWDCGILGLLRCVPENRFAGGCRCRCRGGFLIHAGEAGLPVQMQTGSAASPACSINLNASSFRINLVKLRTSKAQRYFLKTS